MLAPAATPKPIITRIHEILAKQLAAPENQEVFISQGHEPGGDTPEEYAAFIRAETENGRASRRRPAYAKNNAYSLTIRTIN